MNQVKTLSARVEAHDVVDAVYSGYHYPHMRVRGWVVVTEKDEGLVWLITSFICISSAASRLSTKPSWEGGIFSQINGIFFVLSATNTTGSVSLSGYAADIC